MLQHWIYIVIKAYILLFTLYCSMVLVMTRHLHDGVRLAALLALVLAMFMMLKRDTYLPFLGQCVMPWSLFKDTKIPHKANVSADIMIDVPNDTKVLYWGAMPEDGSNKIISHPFEAYNDYNNTGITTVIHGMAKMQFFCPVKYQVPWGKTMNRHIHYRVVEGNGMMGPVKTVYVNC